MILNVLNEYEKISGQLINFDKSSIQFGRNVDVLVRRDIQNSLGISNLGGMGSYLGIPEGLEGAKTKVFAFIKDKIHDRINSWSAKFLSKGGKEILIKSVLTAIPSYVMSCYRLPKTITSKISAAIADFWWHNSGTLRGIHWAKWERLCKTKSEGGLGFRAIEEFNTALLAKQLWRLLDRPDSLLAQVLHGRYYRGGNPLEPRHVYSPSYGWRSIISSRSLVMKGLIRRVGNGDSIKVWQDPWVPDSTPRPAMGPGSAFHPHLRVSDLIDPHSRLWREVLIRQLFDPRDAQLILGIHIPRRPGADKPGWHFTKTGFYSVKSGYWTECNISLLKVASFGPTFQDLQSQAWKVKAPQKIKHFIWQAISGQLAVKANLARRGISCDTRCDRCGAENETVNHVLFECPPAIQAWALSRIPAGQAFPGPSVYSNIDHLVYRIPHAKSNRSFPWILWFLWTARNDKAFSNSDTNPLDLVRAAEAEAAAWENAHSGRYWSNNDQPEKTSLPTDSITRPLSMNPAFTGFRCMVDASWKDSDLNSGLGWYCFSDGVGGVSLGAQSIRRSLSALHAEFEALLWAMTCLHYLQITEVELLVDCSELLKMVEEPLAWPAFLPYLEDFSRLQGLFRVCTLIQIPRLLNHKADFLARNVRISARPPVFVGTIPVNWSRYLQL